MPPPDHGHPGDGPGTRPLAHAGVGGRLRTVAGAVTTEPVRVKGSRFIADLAPVPDEDAALGFLAGIRARHPDASHHCWAFRLASERARSDDDGEPGGTAGPPILRHIEGADLSNVVCVVTRWFGGTKLGTGGLVRAYGDAAAAAIEGARIVVRPVLVRFRVDHDYDLTAPVAGVLAAHEATTTAAEYAVTVTLEVAVPVADAAPFTAAMVEATSGRVRPRRLDAT